MDRKRKKSNASDQVSVNKVKNVPTDDDDGIADHEEDVNGNVVDDSGGSYDDDTSQQAASNSTTAAAAVSTVTSTVSMATPTLSSASAATAAAPGVVSTDVVGSGGGGGGGSNSNSALATGGSLTFDDEDAATEFTTETLNRQWSTGTNSDDRRQQRTWLLRFINKYVPPDVDEGDAFVVVKVLVEAEIITPELVEDHQKRAKGSQRFMSYFEELTDAEWDSTGRITSLYLGYKDLRDCPWELHPDIGRLNKLKHLTVGWCVGLPAELSELRELETLKVTMSVDEMQYEMPATQPPAMELISLKELDARATPGAEGFDLASWISSSTFPSLEVLTLDDEPTSTFSDIVGVMKSLKRHKDHGHHGLRQLNLTNFEIGQNFDTFLLKTIPETAGHLQSFKLQDGKPYLSSVANVASRLNSGDYSNSFTFSSNHLTTLDLQETQLFGHRGGECLIETPTESAAMSCIVKKYKRLTVVGFTPIPLSAATSKQQSVTNKTGKVASRGGKSSSYHNLTRTKGHPAKSRKMVPSSNSSVMSRNSTRQSEGTIQSLSASTKRQKRDSSRSKIHGNEGVAQSAVNIKPETTESDSPLLLYHSAPRRSRGDSYIGHRFAKYFTMEDDNGEDFEKVFFGSITKMIASEARPLQYTVEFDDGDEFNYEVPEIKDGLELYEENKNKDRKKGGTKRKI